VGGERGRSSAMAGGNVPASAFLLPRPPPTLTLPLKGGGQQNNVSQRGGNGLGGAQWYARPWRDKLRRIAA